MLDCGGGTTDAGIYQVAHGALVRLEPEVNDVDGQYLRNEGSQC
jgi:hypothetical protein